MAIHTGSRRVRIHPETALRQVTVLKDVTCSGDGRDMQQKIKANTCECVCVCVCVREILRNGMFEAFIYAACTIL